MAISTASVNTPATLAGNFTEIYAKKIERLIPEEYVLQNSISFGTADRLGNIYHQPVLLQREQGVTYARTGAGAFTLDAAIAGTVQDAQVTASQLMLRGAIDIEALAKAADKSGPKDGAYEDANSLLLENMTMTAKHRLECALWHGQKELGVIASEAGSVVTITPAEWASGIWSGQEGAKVEVFIADGSAKVGTTWTISGVDIANREITLDRDTGSPVDITSSTATNRIFFKTERTAGTTASVENNMVGVHAIQENETTLFNISAADYSLWKACAANGVSGSPLTAGGQLSFETFQDALAIGMGKGLKGDCTMYVNPATWAKLMTDQSALVRHSEKSSSKYEMGAEAICFYSQVGKTTIQSSIMVKEGYAHILKPKLWKRIGATDVTFKVPGRGDEMYKMMESQAGIELRVYYHQAIFSKAPGRSILIDGIDNS